jgi:hypothetical protein
MINLAGLDSLFKRGFGLKRTTSDEPRFLPASQLILNMNGRIWPVSTGFENTP